MSKDFVWLGLDVGGTFTDLALLDASGQVHALKVPSTPEAPAVAALRGIDEFLSRGLLQRQDLDRLVHIHGSTIAVNTLIERRGARLGALVNTGFRDLFELGRLAIPVPTVFTSRRPPPLVERRMVKEISGRLNAAGEEVEPIDGEDVLARVAELRADGADIIVVCLLHSYINASHEEEVARIVASRFDNQPLELSSHVWPQAREFERGVLASINAHIRPAVGRYLDDLLRGTAERGIATEPHITKSNGGCQRALSLRDNPASALLSGTASGVIGAAGILRECGYAEADVVTMDVGGTSADIGVIRGGHPVLSADEHVADLPLLLPTIAVSSIGAGGGSIIGVDETGGITVGPKSAGAHPGPACYGRGGTEPTLTDAILLLGWLPAGQPLAGQITLDGGKARAALSTTSARLGCSPEAAADGAVSIAVAAMAAEMTKVIAKRGVDAPDFALVPFGGAGPLLGALVAEEVYIDRVVIPPRPGILSAIGALQANLEGDLIEPVYRTVEDGAGSTLRRARQGLEARARAWLSRETLLAHECEVVTFSAEMRYERQSFEITVAIEPALLAEGRENELRECFHAAYRRIYGHEERAAAVFVKEVRAHVSAQLPARRFAEPVQAAGHRPPGRMAIWLRGKPREAGLFAKNDLPEGAVITGPAVISQSDSTTLVPDGWAARHHRSGAIILDRGTQP
ncbi:hydantoinase/oxoprolinase family protein [Chelatococcus sp. GCM10030263]|uniref:hydantoinase/oxoprolinase family protein n=1 Tax=Chelatococcus sp. GCM10030263 TaxID=3273387 RepID=UPI0036087571